MTANLTRSNLDGNRVLVLAVVKTIEIIDEAASRVTVEGRAEAPGLPWQQIIAMRNRLIHGYFDVDLDIVWSTVQGELPPLIAELDAIIASHRQA